MTFLAQLCCADSVDLFVRPLPGELLLIFGDDERNDGDVMSRIHVEWSTMKIAEPLAQQHVPLHATLPLKLAGVRHRTKQYDNNDASVFGAHSVYDAIWQGTIIGRAAFCPQCGSDVELIATLGSVIPRMQHWPFVNVEHGPKFRAPKGHDVDIWDWSEFSIGDAGVIAIYLDSNGTVRAETAYS